MPRTPALLLPAVLAALAAGACAEATGPDSAVVATTDATSYVAEIIPGSAPRTRYAFRVVVRIDNRSARPVALARCAPGSTSPIFGVTLQADSVALRSAFDPGWSCVGGVPPLVLAPGATRLDTLAIQGPTAFDGVSGAPRGVTAGLMTIHFASDVPMLSTNAFYVSQIP